MNRINQHLSAFLEIILFFSTYFIIDFQITFTLLIFLFFKIEFPAFQFTEIFLHPFQQTIFFPNLFIFRMSRTVSILKILAFFISFAGAEFCWLCLREINDWHFLRYEKILLHSTLSTHFGHYSAHLFSYLFYDKTINSLISFPRAS